MTRGMFILIALCLLLVSPSLAIAQEQEETAETPQVEEPKAAPEQVANPGPFHKGAVRASFILGAGTAFDNTYLLLGVGGAYYLANGLEAGVELLSWLGQEPTMLQITPELRYVFWKPKRFHPYLGAFYRHTAINNLPDTDSVGGRFGIMYRSGNSYVGIGGVYNHLLDCDDAVFKCDTVYPEVFFSMYW